MMAELGALKVIIGADTSGLKKGTDESRKMFGTLEKDAKMAAVAFGAVAAAAVAAGTALMVNLVKGGLAAIDSQAKLARRLDGTIDGLRGLQIAAKDAGIDTGAINNAIEMLNVKLGEAQLGTGEAARSLERLGLNAKELGRMDVDQRMATIADRMKELGLSTQQSGYELRSLGIRQREVIALMMQGGDAIREARGQVDEFGISISDVDAAKIEQANDAMERIKLTIEAIRNSFTITFAPVLKALADRFNELAKDNRGWGDQALAFAEKLITGISAIANVLDFTWRAFKVAGNSLVWIFGQLSKMIWQVADAIMNGPIRAINELIKLYNLIPGLPEIEWRMPEFKGITKQIEFLNEIIEDTGNIIKRSFTDPMVGNRLLAEYEKIKIAAQKAAEEAVSARRAIGTGALGCGGDGDGGDVGGVVDDEEDRIYLEGLQRRLDRLKESLMAEQELLFHHYKQNMDIAQESFDADIIQIEEFNDIKTSLEEELQAKLTEIANRGAQERADAEIEAQQAIMAQRQATMNAAVGLLQTLGQKSKIAAQAAIALNTAMSISKAIQNTAVAVTATLAAYGATPIGWAEAAKVKAMGVAQIGMIAAQGVLNMAGVQRGGTGAPMPVTNVASPAMPAGGGSPGGGGTTTVIRLEGEIFSRSQVRNLIEMINESMTDGSRLRFA